MTQSVVALYDNVTEAQQAVTDLVTAGIARDHISIVANDAAGKYQTLSTQTDATGAAIPEGHVGPVGGSLFGALVGAAFGLGAVLIPGIGPVIAAGPLIGAAGVVAGAIIGGTTGGITGGLLGLGVPHEDVHTYAEGIRRGGTLVTVSADDGMVSQVHSILDRNHAVNIEDRAANWKKNGWTGFDDAAAPYTADQIETERKTYSTGGTLSGAINNAVSGAVTPASTSSDVVSADVPVDDAVRSGEGIVSGTARVTSGARIYKRSDNSARV